VSLNAGMTGHCARARFAAGDPSEPDEQQQRDTAGRLGADVCFGDQVHVRIRAARVSADLCFAEESPLIRTLGINGEQASASVTGSSGGRVTRRASAFRKSARPVLGESGGCRLSSSPNRDRRHGRPRTSGLRRFQASARGVPRLATGATAFKRNRERRGDWPFWIDYGVVLTRSRS
jgi:hypothetical protein